MKSFTLLNYLIFVSIISLFGFQSSKVLGKDISTQDSKAIISQRAVDLLAQNNSTSSVKITGFKINSTDKGIEVILETVNARNLQPVAKSQGNSLIADIKNAVLSLPDGKDFQVENPAEGIASVTVTQVDANNIRLTVTGESSVPKAELFDSNQALIFVLMQNTSTAQTPQPTPEKPTTENQPKPPSTENNEPIELIVTGERNSYQVPNATSATRTDTPIRDIPQSIQVVPRQVLKDQQVTRLDEALNNVSGVTLGGTNSNASIQFNIRGFNDSPILRDGFRQFGGFQGLPETTDLERVEVLKGPASILYGEVQPGGVINLVSKKPLSEPFYSAELQIGNREFFQPKIDISGPLTTDGDLLYRLNASYQRSESFRDYDQEFKRVFVSPVVSWKIDENTDIDFKLQYSDYDAPLDLGLVAIGNQVADVPFTRIIGEPDDIVNSELFTIGYDLEHRFNENWKIRNAFRYIDRNSRNIGLIAFNVDDDTGDVTRFLGGQNIDVKNYSLQTNVVGEFATGSIEHKLLFGVDLNRSEDIERTRFDFSAPQTLNIFNPVYGLVPEIDPDDIPLARNNDIQTDRLGIYLQDQIALSNQLKLLAGLRYDTIRQKTINGVTDFNPDSSETVQNDDAFTPRVGIVYQPTPEISLYGSYSQSFTPNTVTTVDGDSLKPERGEGFEVGVKADLIKDRLTTTLSYFNITKQNVATPDPNDPLSSIATGKQRSQGIELDVTGNISPGWNVIASYAYIDAEVTEDNTIPVGNRLFNAPRHSASLWTTYEIQKGNLQGLGFGLGFNYVGEREGDLQNSFQLDSYFLTNAAIFYRRKNYRFALNFKNLFDIDYTESAVNRRTSDITVGNPFTVIGSVAVEF
ncbi:MAG: TonB-dependent siderophore receptor [Cyanobacteria bacterium P01_A01_bin.68]